MKTTHALLLVLGFTAIMAIHSAPAYAGEGGGSDVFADEGDVDFDNIPTDVSKVPAAPAMKVQAAAKDTDDAPVAKPTKKHVESDEDAAPVERHEIHRRNVKHEVKKEESTVAADEAPATPATDDSATTSATTAATDAPAERSAMSVPTRDSNGFRTTGKECPMFREPASEGEPMLTVKSKLRIWVEPKGEWVRAYSKSGPGYIAADCLK